MLFQNAAQHHSTKNKQTKKIKGKKKSFI